MEFRKTVKIELEDQISLSFYAAKLQLILFPILVVVLAIAVSLINIDGAIDWFYAIIMLVISIFFAGIAVLASVLSLRYKSKKQFLSNKIIQMPYDFSLDNESVRVSSERGNANVPWTDVYKVGESQSCYFIFISRMQAYVIPKRLLVSGEEETLRALLQQHVASKMCRLQKRG